MLGGVSVVATQRRLCLFADDGQQGRVHALRLEQIVSLLFVTLHQRGEASLIGVFATVFVFVQVPIRRSFGRTRS